MLTDLQLESLKVLKGNSEKVDELLVILGRLEDAKFDVFCSVLYIVGQSAIVKMIRPDAEPTQPRPDESQHSTEQGVKRAKIDRGAYQIHFMTFARLKYWQ